MGAGLDYFAKTTELLNRLRQTQILPIEAAAEICAERIANGGLIFLFGAGHSRMMCEEMTPRQGGFVGFFAMVELAVSNHASIMGTNGLRGPILLEKYEGYVASRLLARGHQPNVLPSHQFVGNRQAEELVDRFYDGYRKSLAHLYV